MPDLVDPCRHSYSSSDDDSLDIAAEILASSIRRSTRFPPTAPLPSYFEWECDDDDAVDDGEVSEDEEEYSV